MANLGKPSKIEGTVGKLMKLQEIHSGKNRRKHRISFEKTKLEMGKGKALQKLGNMRTLQKGSSWETIRKCTTSFDRQA